VYEDGSQFCFSCRKPTGSKVSPYVSELLESSKGEVDQQKHSLPGDVTQNYSQRAVDWCAKYGISVQQMLQTGMVYSPGKEQLLFVWYDENKQLLAYQARNLNAVSKAKRYYTCGDVNNLLPIYPCRFPLPGTINDHRLVLVEDCLSAIKVAATEALGCDSMPLLGSGINLHKLTQLKRFYEVLEVFLDPDMWHKSLNIVKQAQMLGFQARPIQADCDPKELSYNDLKELLK
jgi:hypothetical protein